MTIMAAPARETRETLGERFEAALRRAMARRGATSQPYLVSVGVNLPAIDPLDLFARADGLAFDRFYWDRPADGVSVAGLGAAWTIEAGAPSGAGKAWRALLDDAAIELPTGGDGAGVMDGPLLVGGFAFDPARPATDLWAGYSDSLLALPRVTLVTTGRGSTLTINAVAPDGATAGLFELPRQVEDLLADSPLTPAPSPPRGEGKRLMISCASPLSRTGRASWAVGGAERPVRSGARGGGEGTLSATERPAPYHVEWEDLAPRQEWERLVSDAARACREGALDKVVLARAVRARSPRPFDVAAALRYARDVYPNAYTFAVARGERVFMGATPERLARLQDRDADVACLAGSTRRGATPAEDCALGGALLESAKDRAEHAVVVDAVRAALTNLCDDLCVPAAPRVLRLPNVQHLYTPVTGRVARGVSVLDLVARLHPTPAVGGRPRADALGYIRAHEGLDRGWYAAPIGWLDRHGDGEFVVGLRSALVRGDEATLFAGCGIVADSSPAAEYKETLLKLRPMLAALGAR